MRILHTADWHLGRTLHGESLEEAIRQFFTFLVDTVRSMRVDMVVVAGDIYDRGIPPTWAVNVLSEVLSELSAHATVVITPGNHDSAARLGFAANLLKDSVVIRSDIADIASPLETDEALIYAIPYLEPDLARYSFDPVPGRSHAAVMEAALAAINKDLGQRAHQDKAVVVVGHAFMRGGSPSDSERNIDIGGVSVVPATHFDALERIDYVALGHLHRPQNISGSTGVIRYSGSPIPLSFSEVGTPKAVCVVDVDGGGVSSVEVVPTPVFREMAVITTTMEAIEAGQHDGLVDAWLSVSIVDPVRPDQMVHRVRERFPHSLKVVHEPPRVESTVDVVRVTRETSPRQAMGVFFQDLGGRELDEAEWAVLDEVLAEIVTASS